jgi:hypothetical protein
MVANHTRTGCRKKYPGVAGVRAIPRSRGVLPLRLGNAAGSVRHADCLNLFRMRNFIVPLGASVADLPCSFHGTSTTTLAALRSRLGTRPPRHR